MSNHPISNPAVDAETTRTLGVVTLAVFVVLVISGWQPYDRSTWFMEVAPVFVVFPLLWATRQRFPLTQLLMLLIGLHAVVLIVGGMYSYARVPLGFYLADWLHLSRNPYDKIGHFAQGFVPALAAREILLRGGHVRGPRMSAFLVVCVALAFSATYEMVEWAVALVLGHGADEFLGTQGDVWDTQSDMFFALIGAFAALVTLPRVHDRQMQALQSQRRREPAVG
ncbi:MAG: DUF2238 domain-containing protein [Variovorax sp.]